MCDITESIQTLVPYWLGRSLGKLFPQNVMERFQYDRIIPGHCLVCGRPLAYHEMWSSGKCPRSMCEECYQREIVGNVNDRCIVSGEPLPKEKIKAQRANPREVENNIADGYARDYYTLLACKIVGMDMSFLADDTYSYPKQVLKQAHKDHSVEYNDLSNMNDYIDAEYVKMDHQPSYHQSHRLSFSHDRRRALPPPHEQLRFQPLPTEVPDFVPASSKSKGKNTMKKQGSGWQTYLRNLCS